MPKSYYKTIDGKKYDRVMIEIAEESVAGKGDGRISINDAKKLYEVIIDGNTITKIEQQTLDHIKDNFKFTAPASKWLTEELDSWISQKRSIKKTEIAQTSKSETTLPENTKRIPPKQIAIEATDVNRKASMFWPALALIFLLLLPVVFLIGETTATVEEDPALKIQISELESNLKSRQQDIITLESETNKLKTEILEIKSKQTVPIIQTVKKVLPAVDDAPKIPELVAQELRKSFIKEKISNIQIQFDKDNPLVTLIPEQPFFEKGGAILSSSLKEKLARFFPELIRTIKKYDQNISSIQIQGHSSSVWKFAKGSADAYLQNMNLSIRRSRAALKYCFTLDSMKPHQEWLVDHLVSSGLSISKPVLDTDNNEDYEGSRRISIGVVFSGDFQI